MNFYNNFYIRTFLCISTVLLIAAVYMIHSKAMKNEDFISSRSKRESNDSSSHANDIKKLSVDVINDIYRKINATEEALAAFKANKKTMIHSYKIVCKEVDSKNDNRTYSGNMEYWSSSSFSANYFFYLDDLKCKTFGEDYFLRDTTFSCRTDGHHYDDNYLFFKKHCYQCCHYEFVYAEVYTAA